MKETWAVIYRAASGRLLIVEVKTEREAKAAAKELKGTYQKIDN